MDVGFGAFGGIAVTVRTSYSYFIAQSFAEFGSTFSDSPNRTILMCRTAEEGTPSFVSFPVVPIRESSKPNQTPTPETPDVSLESMFRSP